MENENFIGFTKDKLMQLADSHKSVCLLSCDEADYYLYPDEQVVRIPKWWSNMRLFGKGLIDTTHKTIGW